MNEFKFFSKIKGSSFCGGQDVIPTIQEGSDLVLKAETDNKFDANAVAVYYNDKHIGYVPTDTAAKIQKDVLNNNVKCKATNITGGGEGMSYGCNIELTINREDGTENV